ncbi:HtaA domain-containing protein [Leucobacter rhizosphaerae]|uniref:HtaA domain-containing protein n=1 Tax=Leucobacter rhizosphaerae TaxID=2932245 RepID=A0ABY4FUH7_9MICO|nr:HtaA domain-containing protein [Leucobacter rhizosphaerae]UOQ59959.1 HtaA domain-containing protein [Leucobacter rhizosphaerae]
MFRQNSIARIASAMVTAAVVAGSLLFGAGTAHAEVPDSGTAQSTPVLEATLTLTPNEQVSATVTGAGFPTVDPAAADGTATVTVALVEQGADLAALASSPATVSVGVAPDGSLLSAGSEIQRPASEFDAAKRYEFVAWPSSVAPSQDVVLARVDATIDWQALFPAPAEAVAPEVDDTSVASEAPAPSTAPAPLVDTPAALAAGSSVLSADVREFAEDRIEVNVSGTGFEHVKALPGQTVPHVYLALVPKGIDLATVGQGGAFPNISVDVQLNGTISSGSTPLTDSLQNLDRTTSYEVISWPSRSNPTEANLYARTDAVIDWSVLSPEPEGPALQVDVSEIPGTGIEVDVTGSGFEDVKALPGQTTPHVYLALIPKGTDLADVGQGGSFPNVSVEIARDGTFPASTLEQSSGSLDRTKSYEVISWPSRSNPTEATLYVRADAVIDWDALFPEDVVALSAKITEASKTTGLSVKIEASNLPADTVGSTVTVAFVERGRAVTSSADIAASWTRTVTAERTIAVSSNVVPSRLDRTKTYDVRLFRGTEATQAVAQQLAATPVPVTEKQWEQVFGPRSTATVTVPKIAVVPSGLSVDVRATKLPSTLIYVAIIERGTESELTQDGGYAAFLYQPKVEHGAGNFNFVVPKTALDRKKSYEVLIWQSHSNPDASTIYGRADLKITDAQWDALQGTVPEKPTDPVAPAPAPTGSAAPGSLTWGISSGFADYTTNPSRAGGKSGGKIITSGVGGGTGGYLFPQAAGGAWDATTQTGSVQYSGVVTFTAHKGLMNETFSNPLITVSSATQGSISVSGRSFPLDLGSASKSVGPNGEVTWSGVPVAGAISGGDGSSGGSLAVDPLSFTVGSVSQVSFGATAVGGDDKPKRIAKATAPAFSGITVLTDAEKITPGGRIELEAPGFEASDEGVLVVLYGADGSGPIVLDEEAKANARGLVSWSGTLPKDLTGIHTITFQGSIDVGANIDILDEETTKKAAAEKRAKLETVQEAQSAGIAAPVAVSGGMATWEWWAGAGGLVAIAACMTLLVIRQRNLAP